jgi:hypothetical protein
MAAFNIDLNTELPDRIFVEVDSRFDVAIIRTESGLDLRIYPRTKGELWDAPYATFAVDEANVIALEQEMEV